MRGTIYKDGSMGSLAYGTSDLKKFSPKQSDRAIDFTKEIGDKRRKDLEYAVNEQKR